jgi:hypothetical protein
MDGNTGGPKANIMKTLNIEQWREEKEAKAKTGEIREAIAARNKNLNFRYFKFRAENKSDVAEFLMDRKVGFRKITMRAPPARRPLRGRSERSSDVVAKPRSLRLHWTVENGVRRKGKYSYLMSM